MPTHFQQHNLTKYSSEENKEHPREQKHQQNGSKIIIILNGKLQHQRLYQKHVSGTRKKPRYNPSNSCWKNREFIIGTKDNTESTFDNLTTELEFSYDCLATINVVYESLRHAYSNSKCNIEQQGNDTRLCDMEKELLIAYDDLNLQINHLEKNIIKMEQRLTQLKSMQS
ncbi:hypothetical protein [Parasitella parasitica]|uniref:Uncharacterized protein n=1 Tax=Parasitella parasitica TaxID=35722 RepID=A0A0B7NEH5_9FUNG|nr:hypothetical protein [Parasitella parasitica]